MPTVLSLCRLLWKPLEGLARTPELSLLTWQGLLPPPLRSGLLPRQDSWFEPRCSALFEGNLRVANAVLQESNPIRYASGRYHAVAPRPRRPPALEVDSDSEDCFVPTTTVPITSDVAPALSPPNVSSSVSAPDAPHGRDVPAPFAPLSASISDAPQGFALPAVSLLLSAPASASASGAPRGRDVSLLSSASTRGAPPGFMFPAVFRGLDPVLPLPLPLNGPPSTSTSGVARGCESVLPLSLSASIESTSGAARSRDPVLPLLLNAALIESTSGAPRGSDLVQPLPLSAPSSVSTSGAPQGCFPAISSPLNPSTLPPQPSLYPPPALQYLPNFLPLTATSSQTSTNNIYRQSSITDSISSQNGINTQSTSRMERGPVSAQTRAHSSRNEAMSFLDTIHVPGRSRTSGIITQTQSRSERPIWSSDARSPVRTSHTVSERDRRPTSSRRTEPRSVVACSGRVEHRNGTHGRNGTERRNASERRNAGKRRIGANRAARTTRGRAILRASHHGTHRYR